MTDDQNVIVTCDGAELLSWTFEFPQQGVAGPESQEEPGEDEADRRRDDNLREMFGG